MKKIIVGILSLTALSSTVWGQGAEAQLQKADALFNAGAYTEALKYYRNGDLIQLLDKNLRGEILFKAGESYKRIGQYRQAQIFYEKALDKNYSSPEFFLHYAQVLLINESYDKAKEYFGEYRKLRYADSLADRGIKSIEAAQSWKNNPTSYVVEPLSFLNTRSNDYSPAIIPGEQNTIVLSSSRSNATGSTTHAATGEKFSDIFISQLDKREKWVSPKPLDGINSELEEGTSTFSNDGSTIIFSRARIVKHRKIGAELYVAKKEGDRFGVPKLIPIANDSIVVTHPSLSADGKTLFFSSTLPNGFGGLDIWKVTRDNETADWGKPENLGSLINTRGNEVFPFIHPDGTLYFSSDGKVGMGGLDIFKATPSNRGWIVENMQYPINSSSDDFGITFFANKESGYLSSRRPGGKGGDDIYMFHLPPIAINISGTVVESKSKSPLNGVLVKLLGNDGSTVNMQTDTSGSFKFMLKPNTDYIVIATKKGFLNGKFKQNTFDIKESKEYTSKIELTSYEKPIEIPNIFYDFNKWDLKPESMKALDLLIETLNDNPSIIIELGSHTDSRGALEYNYSLSQKRAQAAVDYLMEKGIPAERLRAKGYASSSPKVVDLQSATQYKHLPAGTILNDSFINKLESEEKKDAAHQLNRRTEFKVISTTYIPRSK